MTQPLHTLVTHAGSFHADEIMALALLEKFYLMRPMRVARNLTPGADKALVINGARPKFQATIDPDGWQDARQPCWVVRTRNPEMLVAARENPDIFVLDVGGELNSELLNFDHHQASMKDAWSDGTPYSSTGLAWRWLKERGYLAELSLELQEEIESTMIRPLDAHDNGVAVCNEAAIVEAFNRHSSENEEQLLQFEKALGFLREALNNTIYRSQAKMQCRSILRDAWAKAQDRGDDFVVLGTSLPSRDGSKILDEISAGRAQLLGVPGAGDRFSLISLRGEDGPFSTRCPVPPAWRGRMDFQVETPGGPAKIAFAHKNGFMCVAEGGREAARIVAREIVRAHRELQAAPPGQARSGPRV